MTAKSPNNNLRCHHCAGPLSKHMETTQWTIPPLIRDSFSMIGSAVGGVTSAFYGFNHAFWDTLRACLVGKIGLAVSFYCNPEFGDQQDRIGQSVGPILYACCPETGKRTYVAAFSHWFKTCFPHSDINLSAIQAPPVIVFSSACAGLAGGAIPAAAQLVSSSYHAAFSSPPLPPPSKDDDKIQKSRTSSTIS
ncbi:unnamed protein product [Lupinus luteus]|uniref:Uncharacterized protein n=1 Tax=Lupinus luteus TaxID=3873 RepID=A0AAV1YDY2_LUPLU